ncbi:S1 family peptidase [[Mycobacterium] crassicus]|uniref:S1 family peptidase n=1 Tax=[Mycobacterium] crassicus TaxID=2872309 RepID=A0ABU5XGR5_9MYCO|nr:S1 family peptidase [Mycolicibacter sp. MYC098]MEB3021488.1 S1 family peptidase [Mycolicibacter sp. MYC098]
MPASPKRSLKTLASRLTVATVFTAILASAIWVNHTHPIRQPIPMPTAKTLGPGIGINVSPADGSDNISCTAGFLVRTKDGQPGLLSAGHCNKPGGPGKVAVHHGGLYKYPVVGTFTESVYDGNDWNDFDIGLITIDHPGKIPLTSEIDGHPVTGLADRVEIGDTLCHFGIRSGGAMCGPVVASEENKVRFTATGTCGDSGGPVYQIQPDGTAQAVGIFTAVSNGDYSEPTCDGPHQYSVGQSIKPWLAAWELTLVTTTPENPN